MKNKLEIFIPTYNRKKNLESSLKQFLDEKSPVKDCVITILDNCSNDGTSEFVQEVAKKHTNVKHVRHSKNIGMGANITRAMEMASKPYYWLVGDDDNYDFSNWADVENAINDGADCIVTADFTLVDDSVEAIMSQLGLLSAGIYKTENVTTEVLQNAYANIINMFPHMALICDLVNKNKKFVITKKPITIWGVSNPDPEGKAYIRGARKESNICPRLKYMFLMPAWFNCLQMIDDDKRRNDLINNTYLYSKLSKDLTNTAFINTILNDNKKLFNNYMPNLMDVFYAFNFKNRCKLVRLYIGKKISAWFYTKTKDEHYRYITFCGIKTKFKRRKRTHH